MQENPAKKLNENHTTKSPIPLSRKYPQNTSLVPSVFNGLLAVHRRHPGRTTGASAVNDRPPRGPPGAELAGGSGPCPRQRSRSHLPMAPALLCLALCVAACVAPVACRGTSQTRPRACVRCGGAVGQCRAVCRCAHGAYKPGVHLVGTAAAARLRRAGGVGCLWPLRVCICPQRLCGRGYRVPTRPPTSVGTAEDWRRAIVTPPVASSPSLPSGARCTPSVLPPPLLFVCLSCLSCLSCVSCL